MRTNWIRFGFFLVCLAPALAFSQTQQHQASLAWTAPSDFASGDSYSVYRGTVTGGPYARIASLVTATTYTDTTVSAGTTYFYVVTHVRLSDGSESPFSNEAKAVIPLPPSPPTNLAITGVK